MKRMLRAIVLLISAVMVVAGFGCAALSHYSTPADKDNNAVEYIVNNGHGHVEDYKGWPWFNLYLANKLKEDLDNSHEKVQHDLRQMMEDDKLEYDQISGTVNDNLRDAHQREEALFGEKGLLSMGMTMAGFGTLTGFLGLMRKRPQDITPEELQLTVREATGKVNGELSAKQKQFMQVVKGISVFMEKRKDDGDTIVALKDVLAKFQDAETEVAVAKAKIEMPV